MSAVTFLFLLSLAVLACGGLTAASRPGGLLYPWYRRLELAVLDHRLSKYVADPLIICETCMASFWGSISWWYSGWMTEESWRDLLAFWPYLVLGCATLNHLLWSIIAVTKAYCKHADDSSVAKQHPQPGSGTGSHR